MNNTKINDKNSEWIGKIPESWELRKIKFVLKQRNENNIPIKSKNILSLTAKQGVIPYAKKEGGGNKPKTDFLAYKLAYPNDIVMNSMNILSGAVGLSKYFGCVSPVYYTLLCQNLRDDVRYFYYVFANKYFQNSLLGIGNGILMKKSSNGTFNTIRMRIPIEKLKNMAVPYPSPQIQNTIANFLDKKVSKIDNLSKDIQQEITDLEKYRDSIITQAVTKGLDKNVTMKDSGDSWIGKIPYSFTLKPLKYVANYNLNTLSDATDPNYEFNYIDIGSVTANHINKYKTMLFKNSPSRARRIVKNNDVIISTVRTYLKAIAFIQNLKKPTIVSTGFIVLSPKKKLIEPKFLKYAVESETFVSKVQAYSVGITYPAINSFTIMNFKIICPSINIQRKIASYLDHKCQFIGNLINKKKEILNDLNNYKQSIIYEYVTGKKQVTNE